METDLLSDQSNRMSQQEYELVAPEGATPEQIQEKAKKAKAMLMSQKPEKSLTESLAEVTRPLYEFGKGALGGMTDKDLVSGAEKALIEGISGRPEPKPQTRGPLDALAKKAGEMGGLGLGLTAGAPEKIASGVLLKTPLKDAMLRAAGWAGLYGGAGAVGRRAEKEGADITPSEFASTGAEGAAISSAIGAAIPGSLGAASKYIKDPLAAKIGRSARSAATPETIEAEKISKKLGIDQTAGEATGSPTLTVIEELGRRHPATAKQYLKRGSKQLEQEVNVAEGIRSPYPKVGEDVTYKGSEIQKTIDKEKEGTAKTASTIYESIGAGIPGGTSPKPINQSTAEAQKVMDELSGAKVEIPSVKSALKGFMPVPPNSEAVRMEASIRKQVPSISDSQMDNLLKQQGFSLADTRAKTGEHTWDQLQTKWKAIGGAIDQAGEHTPEGQLLVRVKKALEGDMNDYAAQIGGDTKRSWDFARNYYAKKSSIWNDPRMAQVLKAHPGDAYEILAKGDKDTVAFMDQIQRVLPPEDLDKVRGAFVHRLLLPDVPFGASNEMRRFIPSHVVSRFEDTEPEIIKSVIGPEGYDRMKEFVTALKKNRGAEFYARHPEGMGGYIVAAAGQAPAAAALEMAKGKPFIAANTLVSKLFSPSLLGRFYLNDALQNMLKTGKIGSAGSPMQREAARKAMMMLSGEIGEAAAGKKSRPAD